MFGVVRDVSQQILGGSLTADAAIGATSLSVSDSSDYDVNGGTVSIAGTLYTYSNPDFDNDIITISPGLVVAASADDTVALYDTAEAAITTELRAAVDIPTSGVDDGDSITCKVLHVLVPYLPEGIRDPGKGESVTIDEVNGDWTITNIEGKTPVFDGGHLAPGTVPPQSLSFTYGTTTVSISASAPASPNVGDIWFDATNGNIMKMWSGTSWDPYQWDGSDTILPGTITGDRIAANAITSNLIAANAIVAGQIAAGAIDAQSIVALSLTSATIAGHILSSQITGSDVVIDSDNGRVLLYQQVVTTMVNSTAPGTSSVTVPAGVTSMKWEAWGGGGGGANGGSTPGGGGGGAGAEYACEPSWPVTPGDTISYTIGSGGATGLDGTDSVIKDNSGAVIVRAHHGPGTFASGAPGPGGTGSTNTIHFDGGKGGSFPGAGGGSSAGTASKGNGGNTGSNSAGGAAPTGGGAGGHGGNNTGPTAATAGTAPGGGGGAGGFNGTSSAAGAAGGAGKVKITYSAYTLIATIASVGGTDALTGTAYVPGIQVLRPDVVGVIGGYYRHATWSRTISPSTVTAITTLTTVKTLGGNYGTTPWSGATFTVPDTAPYTIFMEADNMTVNTAGKRAVLLIRKNGTTIARTHQGGPDGGGANQMQCSAVNVWLTAGDTIDFVLYNDDIGGSTVITGYVTVKREA